MVEFGHGMDDNAPGSRTARVKVSCIIPTLNRSDVLLRTIEQLFAQTEVPEIIVVDQTLELDPSTKSTLSAWSSAGRIHWVHQRDPNASKARNAGASVATGDVLLFLDDDIEVNRAFVATHARNYLDPKVLAVSGQILESAAEVTTKLRFPPEDPDRGWIWFPKNFARDCTTSWVGGGNFSVRRAVYFEVGGMDENYTRGAFREETDFAMRLLQKGYRFSFDPSASIIHLGAPGAPIGGSRSWSANKRIAGWHHCVGDWYFTLGFVNRRNWYHLLVGSLRHFVFNRYNVERVWLVPILLMRWIAALPIAAYRRLRGARLVSELTPLRNKC